MKKNLRPTAALFFMVAGLLITGCSDDAPTPIDAASADKGLPPGPDMALDGNPIRDSAPADQPDLTVADDARTDLAVADSSWPDASRADATSNTCKDVNDCPLQPPPLKCLGSHWECEKGKCVGSCGNPKRCDSQQRYAKEEMKRIGACMNDNTCKLKTLGVCPFGCLLPYQWAQSDARLMTLIGLFVKNTSCQKCQYRCPSPNTMSVRCTNKMTCEAVVDRTCKPLTKPAACLTNAACRAVFGPSCPACKDYGYRRCVPIEATGCLSKQTKARAGKTGACTTFSSPCNVPHGWTLCP